MSICPEHCMFLFFVTLVHFTFLWQNVTWVPFTFMNWKGTELKMFSSFSTLANCEKTSYTQYFWQKFLGYSQMKAQTTLIKKILLLFLRKLPKEYCKCHKRNRKLRSVHVHLVRNELSSAHIHFSLLKSDQHSVHERELNVNWMEKVQFLQCSGYT